MAGTAAVVAAMGLMARPTENDFISDCADECEAWDSGYQREIIDGMTVYYGSDLCDSGSGRIRMMSLVDNMWINIILICWRVWNR